MMDTIYCQGCGVQIQTENKDELGYTPESALNREEVICQRCFRLKHYNEVQDVDLKADDYIQMLNKINTKNGLIVKVVDLFDVHGSFIPHLKRIVGKKPIVLIGNKVDLLPQSVNLNKVRLWLKKTTEDYGLNVEAIFLVSSVKGIGMDEASLQLERLRKSQNIYVVGSTNVGKSTFINYLINQTLKAKDVITTSYFPGTTLGFIEIPLDKKSYMIDTPGVINHHQIVHLLSGEDLKVITPRKEVKPRVYQMNDGQALFFGGLARLDIDQADEKKGYVCYFANELNIHRTKKENADQLYEKHIGEMLSPPSKQYVNDFPKFEQQTFELDFDHKVDLVISGLGWITIGEGLTQVTAHVPKGVHVTVRNAII